MEKFQPGDGMLMTRTCLFTLLLIASAANASFAGTIEGRVSPGQSVVYVDAIPGKTFPPPTQDAIMGQKNLAFEPHILVVQQGTTVQFVNSDNEQHNVFWPSVGGNKRAAHNVGTWPQGEKRPFKFDQPGVVPLFCNIHAEMSGFIIVSPTPYFVQTDSAGNYKIDNVPDGKYNVAAWHEGMKPQTKPVTVPGTGGADFTLTK
jgi:plastocyanin